MTHGDRDYLKFLQESTFVNRNQITMKADPNVYLNETDLVDVLDDFLESDDWDDFFPEIIFELNTGALKSFQHLMGVYDKQLSRMSHNSVDKPRLLAKMTGVQNKINDLEQAGRDAAKAAKEAAKAAKEAVQDKVVAVADKTKEVASSVVDKTKEVAVDAADKTKEVAGDVAKSAGEKIGGAVSKAGEYISQNPGTAAGIAVGAAAAVAAGVMAYKRFFSKGAKACKNAPDRPKCMKELKIKAMGARIQAMNAGKAKCANTKNPAKCTAKIDQKIAATKTKMAG
jgi:hypothetical protein